MVIFTKGKNLLQFMEEIKNSNDCDYYVFSLYSYDNAGNIFHYTTKTKDHRSGAINRQIRDPFYKKSPKFILENQKRDYRIVANNKGENYFIDGVEKQEYKLFLTKDFSKL